MNKQKGVIVISNKNWKGVYNIVNIEIKKILFFYNGDG